MDLRDDDDPGTRRRVRAPPVHNPYARRTPAPHSAGPLHAAEVTQSPADAEPLSPRPHFRNREIRALFDIDDAVDAAPVSDHHVRDGPVRDVAAAVLDTAVDHNEPDAPADADRLAHDANPSEYNAAGRIRRVVADVAVEESTDDAQHEGNVDACAFAGGCPRLVVADHPRVARGQRRRRRPTTRARCRAGSRRARVCGWRTRGEPRGRELQRLRWQPRGNGRGWTLRITIKTITQQINF